MECRYLLDEIVAVRPRHGRSIRRAMVALAALGGHQKHKGDPGWRTLWAGLHKLLSLEAGYRLAKEM